MTEDDPSKLFDQASRKAADGGAAGRTFTFQGTELQRFSFTHRMAYNRLMLAGNMTQLEADTLLIYLLTKSAREADKARGDEQEGLFRLAANEWAEKLPGGFESVTTALMESAKAIREDVEKSERIEPDTKGAAGNA